MPNNPAAKPSTFPLQDAQARVLRFLWRSRAEWSGREIARKSGLSAPSCHATLKKLDAGGLVEFRRVSNVHLYKINPENYLVRYVYARLFDAEGAMPKQIAATVKKSLVDSPKSDIISIVLFGGMARGAEQLGGDLDLLVVLPAKASLKALEPRLALLRILLFKQFSVPLAAHIQTLPELRSNRCRKLPLVRAILKDGRTVYGKDLKELLS